MELCSNGSHNSQDGVYSAVRSIDWLQENDMDQFVVSWGCRISGGSSICKKVS